MTATQAETTTATVSFPTSAPVGFTMPCPCCGEASASVAVLRRGDDAFFCRECEAGFSFADLQARITRWAKVMTWAASAPQFDDE